VYSSPPTLALVESPVQLLHVLEWRHQHQNADVRVAILAPRASIDRNQLSAVKAIAEDSGVHVTWLDPRVADGAPINSWLELRRLTMDAGALLIGDPFSGLIQSILPVRSDAKVIVVDDGTSTIDFADLLHSHKPLLRWASRPGPVARVLRRPLASRANRFYTGRAAQNLQLFTVMPVESPPGATVKSHVYEWTRQQFGAPTMEGDLTVVGSSLVETGILKRASYLEAVRAEASKAGGRAGFYLAHRRELPDKLAEIAAKTRLTIIQAQMPLEIELRRTSVARHVVCFPSTPAYTLPLVLQDTGATFEVVEIDPSWIRETASVHAVAFLSKMGVQLRERYRDNSASS
jgi:hypothetical protein